jgi:hypothetical protein
LRAGAHYGNHLSWLYLPLPDQPVDISEEDITRALAKDDYTFARRAMRPRKK